MDDVRRRPVNVTSHRLAYHYERVADIAVAADNGWGVWINGDRISIDEGLRLAQTILQACRDADTLSTVRPQPKQEGNQHD